MAELVIILEDQIVRASASSAVAVAAITLAGVVISCAWLWTRTRVPVTRTVKLSSGIIVRI